ncbi:hypothetical protein [Lactobacillus sp.]|uniref:hypothetical protein n=1 Tax=Lactobacillus sp. TaxID=1591 RepID=UPI0025E8780E|nr:hypothetical protein [Lactobacillus sp.]MCO6535749.1 hypothetical protein [Lactobacillus sp.]
MDVKETLAALGSGNMLWTGIGCPGRCESSCGNVIMQDGQNPLEHVHNMLVLWLLTNNVANISPI